METKVLIPGIQIDRLRWLYNGKEYKWMKKNSHTRESVIRSLPTEALQLEEVRDGIVLNSKLYAVQLWSPWAQVKQCFNCSQWGQIQASCNKARKCGECVGTYQARDCPKNSVLCCNCGNAHLSWQKGGCLNFASYEVSVQRARYGLMKKTAQFRRDDNFNSALTLPSTARTTDDQVFTLVSYKKADGGKREPERPRKQLLVPAPAPLPIPPSGPSSGPQACFLNTRRKGFRGIFFSYYCL